MGTEIYLVDRATKSVLHMDKWREYEGDFDVPVTAQDLASWPLAAAWVRQVAGEAAVIVTTEGRDDEWLDFDEQQNFVPMPGWTVYSMTWLKDYPQIRPWPEGVPDAG